MVGRISDAVTLQGWASRYLAEFIGTYLLVLTIGLNVIAESVCTAIAVGFVLSAMVYAFGPLSGAHFNPSVTLAVVLRGLFLRQKNLEMTALYMPVQLLAGWLAGLSYYRIRGTAFHLTAVGLYSWKSVVLLEVLYSAALCYIVLGVTSSVKERHVSGLAVGFTVLSAAVTIGGVSGCCLNPAVSFAASSSSALQLGFSEGFRMFLTYFLSPFVGSAVGLVLYALVFPDGTYGDETKK
eukprot:TRINITY_DN62758_c0_g1_i1.p1 TRINITY_DN62758_c0_g1~~TRINITY_DN62758_c0_g1_i1.p1  ORF type:complete len:238 (-),score=28.08 TRINITY_DN62758_c0_g1_i1:69-782(-)